MTPSTETESGKPKQSPIPVNGDLRVTTSELDRPPKTDPTAGGAARKARKAGKVGKARKGRAIDAGVLLGPLVSKIFCLQHYYFFYSHDTLNDEVTGVAGP